MPDTFAPRSCSTQQTNYEKHRVRVSAAGLLAGVQLGTIPLKAFITKVMAYVEDAFDAGTTNVLTLGTTQANANELFAAGDITPGTVGYTEGTKGRGTQLTQQASPPTVVGGQAVDTTEGGVGLWAKFASTGTAPTKGTVVFVVEYVPDLVNY